MTAFRGKICCGIGEIGNLVAEKNRSVRSRRLRGLWDGRQLTNMDTQYLVHRTRPMLLRVFAVRMVADDGDVT